MSSLTRGQRRLLQFATNDGELPNLKRKRAEDIAPVLRQKAEKRHRSLAGTADTESSPLMLYSDVLNFLKEHAPKAPHKLRRSQLSLVSDLSMVRKDVPGEQENGEFAVKRIETLDHTAAFTMIALAALQRRALRAAEESHGASLLVIAESDADVKALASHVKKTYKITRSMILKGEGAHPYPTIPKGHIGACTLAERTVLVIASLRSFLEVDAQNAFWKSIGAYVVLLNSSSGKIPASVVDEKSEDAKKEFMLRLSRQRWQCLGHVPVAAVMATSRKALLAPLADALTILKSFAGGESRSRRITTNMHREKSNNNNNSNNNMNNKIAIATDGIKHGEETPETELEAHVAFAAFPSSPKRQPVTIHYAVVEGSHRFQTLYTLLMGLRAGQGVVVHFATKESCQFMYNILYALGELPASLLLLTDYEGPSIYSSAKDTDEDRRQLCNQFNTILEEASGKNSSGAMGRDRVVLLSAFGLAPQMGTIFIQYDIILDIVNFAQFIGDVLTPAAYRDIAHDSRIQQRLLTPPSTRQGREVNNKELNAPDAASTTGLDALVAKKTMYQHILILLRRNELQGSLRYLQDSGKRLQMCFEPMEQLPSVTRFLLSAQKMRSLHKKQFSVQNEAYAAYRATMLLYSIIGPRDVYDERRVDLTKVAEEFGYSVPPILDLRTRDTVFRPKEDVFRAAMERATIERRRLRAYVAANIVGEVPEPHVADSEDGEV